MWSHDDAVSVFAAVGPSKSGWDELEPMFHSVAARLSGGHDVTYEIMSFDVNGDMAWTAGFTSFTTTMDGGPPTVTRFARRMSSAVKAVSGRWFTSTQTSNLLRTIRARPISVGTHDIAPGG
jgi:ketosteroid isomerase-like protein